MTEIKEFIILICGDRNWSNFNVIEDYIKTLPKNAVIIEDNCRGADKISGYLGRKHGLAVIRVSAKWDKFGNYAGPLRNSAMIHCFEPNLVVAFHNDVEHSKGTKNMVWQARKANIQTFIINEKGEKYEVS